jgi:hypothetical protein
LRKSKGSESMDEEFRGEDLRQDSNHVFDTAPALVPPAALTHRRVEHGHKQRTSRISMNDSE